jgi:hypothetical protein
MRGFSSYLGVVALLQVLVTAPFFHSHDHDDHGHSAGLIHAHFAEEPQHDDHTGPGYETPKSHNGRTVDVYTLSMPMPGFDLPIDFETAFAFPVLLEQAGVVLLPAQRAHGPPAVRRSSPRSPPPTV